MDAIPQPLPDVDIPLVNVLCVLSCLPPCVFTICYLLCFYSSSIQGMLNVPKDKVWFSKTRVFADDWTRLTFYPNGSVEYDPALRGHSHPQWAGCYCCIGSGVLYNGLYYTVNGDGISGLGQQFYAVESPRIKYECRLLEQIEESYRRANSSRQPAVLNYNGRRILLRALFKNYIQLPRIVSKHLDASEFCRE